MAPKLSLRDFEFVTLFKQNPSPFSEGSFWSLTLQVTKAELHK